MGLEDFRDDTIVRTVRVKSIGMSNLLIKPRYLALDSSHLGDWVRDYVSQRSEDRAAAAAFESWLERSGYVLLICFHHIEELLNHNDENTALSRLRFISRRKLIAWIKSPDNSIGGIVTILAEEIRAAHEICGGNISEIRNIAKGQLIQI
ncbi:hypothetical protein GCM10017653_33080 [Ancylobacter defluvii]|uniref:Uncharacterized protein n=1 Tax=Ancylobacter defluvii TaxID=1282440 RepID=A0A9W6K1I1_9HYPH|nr:hypothetical protein GCM10017653_33080 [Ancylobacter defluvii]